MAGSVPSHFAALVEAHGPGVYRLCRAILRDDHLGADAAQEAFLRLWRRLGGAGGAGAPDSVRAWLRKAAVSSALDLARRQELSARSIDARGAAQLETAPDDPRRAPEAAAERRELEAMMARAVAELPEGQRTIFLLRHEGGLSLGEVAETLGVQPATVKTQFARACLKLQGRLRCLRDQGTET